MRCAVMALAEWMIPELSVSAAVELENSKRVLRNHARSNPDQVAAIACSVMEQAVLQQAIVRNATKHIAELEMVLFLSETSTPRSPYYVTTERLPWWKALSLRCLGFQPASGPAPSEV